MQDPSSRMEQGEGDRDEVPGGEFATPLPAGGTATSRRLVTEPPGESKGNPEGDRSPWKERVCRASTPRHITVLVVGAKPRSRLLKGDGAKGMAGNGLPQRARIPIGTHKKGSSPVRSPHTAASVADGGKSSRPASSDACRCVRASACEPQAVERAVWSRCHEVLFVGGHLA
jgi:hypothetical protein